MSSRAARIMNAGQSGQILLSQTTRDLVERNLKEGVSLRYLGANHLKDLEHLSRDNNVLYFMNIYSSKRLKVGSRHSPRFPLEQKRREHVQEALVKETGLNDEVESPEQRGCSLLEEVSVIPPLFALSYMG